MILKEESYNKVRDVEYNIGKRWQCGVKHHPKSIELFDRIQEIDFVFNNDHFGWKKGGDGDSGETLMYILDIIFEEQDQNRKTQ